MGYTKVRIKASIIDRFLVLFGLVSFYLDSDLFKYRNVSFDSRIFFSLM